MSDRIVTVEAVEVLNKLLFINFDALVKLHAFNRVNEQEFEVFLKGENYLRDTIGGIQFYYRIHPILRPMIAFSKEGRFFVRPQ